MSTLTWSPAEPHELLPVLELMREFYVEDHLIFEEDRAKRAVRDLLETPAFGQIFLLRPEAGEERLGYFACTIGYSLEFGGRYVLLDELYLRPRARGRGEAKRVFALLKEWALKRNIPCLRLEVNHANTQALAVYSKTGFKNDERHLLSQWLKRAEP